MKANDLQLGDHIAYISGEHCSVRELNRKGLIAVSFIDAKGKMQYSTLLPERDFEPIPLTAEILEKNFTQHSRYKYDYCTDYFDLYITEYTDGLWCVTVDEIEMGGLPTWKMYVSNVHELQHALRLCNIDDKEIEI